MENEEREKKKQIDRINILITTVFIPEISLYYIIVIFHSNSLIKINFCKINLYFFLIDCFTSWSEISKTLNRKIKSELFIIKSIL